MDFRYQGCCQAGNHVDYLQCSLQRASINRTEGIRMAGWRGKALVLVLLSGPINGLRGMITGRLRVPEVGK